jgi:hypothetical protein
LPFPVGCNKILLVAGLLPYGILSNFVLRVMSQVIRPLPIFQKYFYFFNNRISAWNNLRHDFAFPRSDIVLEQDDKGFEQISGYLYKAGADGENTL